jgi:UPF0271 protein
VTAAEPLRVDLNADVGEGGPDGELIPLVSSVNVACGAHAGDPESIRAAVQLAARSGAAIGAHPSLLDRAGFGRRDLPVTPDEAFALTLSQAQAVQAIARKASRSLAHVKPHGALYNKAATDRNLAEAIAAAARELGPGIRLYGLPFSEMEQAASRLGVPFAAEVFADRTYRADGSLTPRTDGGAFVTDPLEAARRVVRMLREGRVRAATGEWVRLRADTVCVHGDTPGALAFVTALRAAFRAEGVLVWAPGEASGEASA